jgi:hypothetical protein
MKVVVGLRMSGHAQVAVAKAPVMGLLEHDACLQAPTCEGLAVRDQLLPPVGVVHRDLQQHSRHRDVSSRHHQNNINVTWSHHSCTKPKGRPASEMMEGTFPPLSLMLVAHLVFLHTSVGAVVEPGDTCDSAG